MAQLKLGWSVFKQLLSGTLFPAIRNSIGLLYLLAVIGFTRRSVVQEYRTNGTSAANLLDIPQERIPLL
jgi:hypothetical protein